MGKPREQPQERVPNRGMPFVADVVKEFRIGGAALRDVPAVDLVARQLVVAHRVGGDQEIDRECDPECLARPRGASCSRHGARL